MAYITIRSRLIDLIRKKNRRADKETATDLVSESAYTDESIDSFDPFFWERIQNALTDNSGFLFVAKSSRAERIKILPNLKIQL